MKKISLALIFGNLAFNGIIIPSQAFAVEPEEIQAAQDLISQVQKEARNKISLRSLNESLEISTATLISGKPPQEALDTLKLVWDGVTNGSLKGMNEDYQFGNGVKIAYGAIIGGKSLKEATEVLNQVTAQFDKSNSVASSEVIARMTGAVLISGKTAKEAVDIYNSHPCPNCISSEAANLAAAVLISGKSSQDARDILRQVHDELKNAGITRGYTSQIALKLTEAALIGDTSPKVAVDTFRQVVAYMQKTGPWGIFENYAKLAAALLEKKSSMVATAQAAQKIGTINNAGSQELSLGVSDSNEKKKLPLVPSNDSLQELPGDGQTGALK